MEWKNRKTHWYQAASSAFNFPFLKEVSQNCFVFDVVNFENWGGLAELLRFWRCQVQKLRKSRTIALFSNVQKDRYRWIDRQLQLHYYFNYNYKYKYTMPHYTTLITPHCSYNYYYSYSYNYKYNYITLLYTNYATQVTLHYNYNYNNTTATLRYTNFTTLHYNYNCNYNYIPLRYNYNNTTTTLHYTNYTNTTTTTAITTALRCTTLR